MQEEISLSREVENNNGLVRRRTQVIRVIKTMKTERKYIRTIKAIGLLNIIYYSLDKYTYVWIAFLYINITITSYLFLSTIR